MNCTKAGKGTKQVLQRYENQSQLFDLVQSWYYFQKSDENDQLKNLVGQLKVMNVNEVVFLRKEVHRIDVQELADSLRPDSELGRVACIEPRHSKVCYHFNQQKEVKAELYTHPLVLKLM